MSNVTDGIYQNCLSHWSSMSQSAFHVAKSFKKEIQPIMDSVGGHAEKMGVTNGGVLNLDMNGPALLAGKPVFIFCSGVVPPDLEGNSDSRFALGYGGAENKDVSTQNISPSTPAQYTGTGWASAVSGVVYIIFFEPERKSKTGTSCVPIAVSSLSPDFTWYIVGDGFTEIRKGPVSISSPHEFVSALFAMEKIEISTKEKNFLSRGVSSRQTQVSGGDAQHYLSNIGDKVLTISKDSEIVKIKKIDGAYLVKNVSTGITSEVDGDTATREIDIRLLKGYAIHFGQAVTEKYLSAYDMKKGDSFLTGSLKMISAEALIKNTLPGTLNGTPEEILKTMESFSGSLVDMFRGKKICVFDLETTGLNPMSSQINQIAAIIVDGDSILRGESAIGKEINLRARLYTHTKRALAGSNSKAAIALRKQGIKVNFYPNNVINEDDLPQEVSNDLPSESEILQSFSKWCTDNGVQLMIAHNAKFDSTMMYHRGFHLATDTPVLDSVKLIDLVLIPAARSVDSQEWAKVLISGFSNKYMSGDHIRDSKGNRGFVSKLGVAAKALGVAPEGGYHDAIVDVRVTANVVSQMLGKILNFFDLAKKSPEILSKAYRFAGERANAQAIAHGFLSSTDGVTKVHTAYVTFVNDLIKVGISDPLIKSWLSLRTSINQSMGVSDPDEFLLKYGLRQSSVVDELRKILQGKVKLYFTRESPATLLHDLGSLTSELTRWENCLDTALGSNDCINLKVKLSLMCFSLDIDKALKNVSIIVDGDSSTVVSLSSIREMFKNSL